MKTKKTEALRFERVDHDDGGITYEYQGSEFPLDDEMNNKGENTFILIRGTNAKHIAERLEALQANEVDVIHMCINCSNQKGMKELQETGHISCCPERDMQFVPIRDQPKSVDYSGWKEQPDIPEQWAYLRDKLVVAYEEADKNYDKGKFSEGIRYIQGAIGYAVMHINAHSNVKPQPVDVEGLKDEIGEVWANSKKFGSVDIDDLCTLIAHLHQQGYLNSTEGTARNNVTTPHIEGLEDALRRACELSDIGEYDEYVNICIDAAKKYAEIMEEGLRDE